MDPQAHFFGQDIEAPIPILFWEPLEFIAAICFLGFGMLADIWLFGALGAFIVLIGSKYLKRGAKRGAVQHWLWFIGLQLDTTLKKRFPAAWENEFIN